MDQRYDQLNEVIGNLNEVLDERCGKLDTAIIGLRLENDSLKEKFGNIKQQSEAKLATFANQLRNGVKTSEPIT